MTVAVISAIFGSYDTPKVHAEQSVDTKFLLLEHDSPTMHPRLAAKRPKLAPWTHAPGVDAWIWIDGAFEIKSPTFVEEAVACSSAAMSMWAHPWRDCLYDEAEASADIPKYANQPIREQAAHYRRRGFPEHAGLWAAGLIVYRQRLDGLAAAWWAEMQRWGYQDQISLPVALRAAGVAPTALPYGYCSGPWLQWHPHRSES